MTNIDEFNRACSLIFAFLYDSFPVGTDIDPITIGFIADGSSDMKSRALFGATMAFLRDEGFIIFDNNSRDLHIKTGARLTSKGLTRLQRVPNGIKQGPKSLIDHLKDSGEKAVSQATTTSTNEALKALIQYLFA